MKIVGEVIPEEFFEKERLDSGKDIDAALLAIECLELGVVTTLVSLLFHPRQV